MQKHYECGEFHRMLARTHHLHVKLAGVELAKVDISQGQPRILHYLAEHDGCIQKELCDQCDFEAATVTNILALMEKSGLIRRESVPEDRRVLRVLLTSKGRQTNEKVQLVFGIFEVECFKGFTEREKEHTIQYLERIYANLKKVKERGNV